MLCILVLAGFYCQSISLSSDELEDWKYGSREDNEHSVSSNLPVFQPSSKPKIYFLILLKYKPVMMKAAPVII